MKKNQEITFRCECGASHFVTFTHFPPTIMGKTTGGEELYVSLKLLKYSFWNRVKDGIEYIFKGVPINCDEVILDTEKIDKLVIFLGRLKRK
jgi:hypothetical protein